MHADLALALELADLADAITLERFRAADLEIETKPDLTPVTEADRAVEQVLRKRIAEERPGHGVVGEEFGADEGGDARWIVDLIDVERDGALAVGMVSAPALQRRWWAARGEGAFADGRPIRVSKVADLADAVLSHASLGSWEEHGLGDRFMALTRRCWRTRGFGDFWSHMLVAEGAADVAAEPEVALWDLAAVQVVVEEAGGRLTDLGGTARPDGGSVVTTNGLLHDRVLAALRP